MRIADSKFRHAQPAGFTLVELLVVIGIIALLISILIPALNKARQQANLIDCQSRLRQMGEALGIYVSENAGMLPYGDVRHDPTATTPWENNVSDPGQQEFSWFWDFTLSKEIQANIAGPDGLVHNLSSIFHDVDTIDLGFAQRYYNDYTCNPRIFPDNWEDETVPDGGTPILPQYVKPRRMSNIKPSSVFLFWDAPQLSNWDTGVGNNAYEEATEIDGNNLEYGTYLFLNSTTAAYTYNRPVSPGLWQAMGNNPTRYAQEQVLGNVDIITSDPAPDDDFNTHLRFRHMNNTKMNALCVDGHVETRTVGTFMVTDICIQPPG